MQESKETMSYAQMEARITRSVEEISESSDPEQALELARKAKQDLDACRAILAASQGEVVRLLGGSPTAEEEDVSAAEEEVEA